MLLRGAIGQNRCSSPGWEVNLQGVNRQPPILRQFTTARNLTEIDVEARWALAPGGGSSGRGVCCCHLPCLVEDADALKLSFAEIRWTCHGKVRTVNEPWHVRNVIRTSRWYTCRRVDNDCVDDKHDSLGIARCRRYATARHVDCPAAPAVSGFPLRLTTEIAANSITPLSMALYFP
ncbi:hypothetical protein BR93DRAFT_62251 [Coniochaeta sp. PMI_546]|nr:hypothetical protein BR93DRAFT_62251 [Coniochaeta sp. PMI_546]